MFGSDSRDRASESDLEPRPAMEHVYWNPVCPELAPPDAVIVQTTHGHRHITLQAPDQLDDETFSASGVEAQDNLEDPHQFANVRRVTSWRTPEGAVRIATTVPDGVKVIAEISPTAVKS